MAKFINTSATTYYLEEIIKNASDRLILISPYLINKGLESNGSTLEKADWIT